MAKYEYWDSQEGKENLRLWKELRNYTEQYVRKAIGEKEFNRKYYDLSRERSVQYGKRLVDKTLDELDLDIAISENNKRHEKWLAEYKNQQDKK